MSEVLDTSQGVSRKKWQCGTLTPERTSDRGRHTIITRRQNAPEKPQTFTGLIFGGGSNPKTKTGTWREPGFPATDNSPVTHVSAADADAMADYLSKTEGVRYWVPTEAEWRWACRAGANTRYPFGENAKELTSYAVFQLNSSGRPSPVAGMRANAWGLFDMLGNVREWCADGAAAFPEGQFTDPRAPVKANGMRVQCGGTFNGRPEYAGRPGWESASCDCDTRGGTMWYLTTVDVGFRLCREP